MFRKAYIATANFKTVVNLYLRINKAADAFI